MSMYIDTVRFASIPVQVLSFCEFFSRTAFIISHKSEDIESLLGVLWFLPESSSIIVVTNCPPEQLAALASGLRERLIDCTRRKIYLIHQKDAHVAAFFRDLGIDQILGADGRVVDGKGEGMYIGALCAASLGSPSCKYVIYYDADNFMPSALLEYTFAMARLFTRAHAGASGLEVNPITGGEDTCDYPRLHNVRICWASKPSLNGESVKIQQLGRCSKVVSPLVSQIFTEVGRTPTTIVTSNAGEQGMTLRTATALRFTSKYSIESFQLLELFARGLAGASGPVLLQQYQAQSAHFHEKGDDEHIKMMIAQSLGCFSLFPTLISPGVDEEVRRVCDHLAISPELPRVYPALETIGVLEDSTFLQRYDLQVAPEQIGDLAVYETTFAAEY